MYCFKVVWINHRNARKISAFLTNDALPRQPHQNRPKTPNFLTFCLRLVPAAIVNFSYTIGIQITITRYLSRIIATFRTFDKDQDQDQ